MSLINQVLKDLDERRSVEYSEHKTELDDLHFAHTPPRKSKTWPLLLGSIILVVLIMTGFAAFYFYEQVTNNPYVAEVSRDVKTKAAQPVVAQAPPVVVNEPVVSETVKAPEVNPVVTRQVERITSKSKATVQAAQKQKPEAVATVAATSDAIQPSEQEQVDDTPVKFTKSTVPLRAEQKAELAYQTGYDHLKAQRHRQAEQSLRRALAMESGHIKARELLAGIYIKQGRWVEASELLRDGVTYSPQHLTFAKLYARSLMQLNRDKQAIVILEKYAPAVESDPNYFATLAALYQRQKQHQQAGDLYARLVSINPRNGVWWVGLGISLEALGREQDAVRAYGHARKTGNLREEVARFTNNRLLALDEINFPRL